MSKIIEIKNIKSKIPERTPYELIKHIQIRMPVSVWRQLSAIADNYETSLQRLVYAHLERLITEHRFKIETEMKK